MTHKGFGYMVDSCPKSQENTAKAATRLNCSDDVYGRSQYVCVPNEDLTAIVEFCYTKSIVAPYQNGSCIQIKKDGFLYQISCKNFTEGCPTQSYRGTDLYKYPACSRLDTKNRCFHADPSCNSTWNIATSNTTLNLQPTTSSPKTSFNVAEIVVGVAASLLILAVILILAVVLWGRKKSRKKRTQEPTSIEAKELLLAKGDGIPIVPEKIEMYIAVEKGLPNISLNVSAKTKVKFGKDIPLHFKLDDEILQYLWLKKSPLENEYRVLYPNDKIQQKYEFKFQKRKRLIESKLTIKKFSKEDEGNYYVAAQTNEGVHLWKEAITTDQFSTLTEDEVSVLFCFLCSDSSPTDFTDKEWLGMLNKIRWRVYDKKYLVSREEAQQTLDRLKSRAFLWADQTAETLNDNTQEKIMNHVTSDSAAGFILFYLSSFITAQRYLRSERYIRKPEEKCVISYNRGLDSLLILRLQMSILTHVTMEDRGIFDNVSKILNIPMRTVMGSEVEQRDFQQEIKQTGERIRCRKASHDISDQVTWLWRYKTYARPNIVRSCIGLHPHNDIYIIENKAYRKPSACHTYPPDIRCLLYCVLLVDNYSLDVNNQNHKVLISILSERYFTGVHFMTDIQEESVIKEGNIFRFKSGDIRHGVMYAFVTECLVEDSDLQFFLTTASRDVISEYCRSWGYVRSKGERCLYVPDCPEKMYDLLIDKLQLDIISHCTISDRGIHHKICKLLKIPEEVLRWDIHARERFVKNSKQGRKKVFRARGMVVGCAGAGKTTLLRKLQERKETDKDKPTETTVGLQIHENLFAIEHNALKDYDTRKANSENQYHDSNVISMTDFAGQVAYYACHQVHLSRRAFYIVVVDMSRKLDEESRMYDTDRHDPTGSLFHSWTYRDYFYFWMQTINTYCNDGINQRDPKYTSAFEDSMTNANLPPVILIASHKDKQGGILQTSDTFYCELEASFSENQTLKELISPFRYFEVECPPKALSPKQQLSIDRVKKCIVETVQKLPHWGEEVPFKWFEFEKSLNGKKANGEKILKWSELRETAKSFSIDDDLDDVLRFLHEIGKIIHFSVDKLKETIIIDVQWFVDAFKYIITDEKHFAREDNRNELVNTGRITGLYIEQVWKSIKDLRVNVKNEKHQNFSWQSYLKNKDDILLYMDKLGLMTRIEAQVSVYDGEEMYYIPSMNRTDLPDDKKDAIHRKPKSPMMVYFFKSYLPHFFFFRLVVSCLKKWSVCNEDSFFKNAAFYKAEEAGHNFVIAVSKTSIQLQVFTRDEMVKEECVKKIRMIVEDLIEEITETFHKGIIYDMGFTCTDIQITDEDEEFFLKESDIAREIRYLNEMSCPRHFLSSQDHKMSTNEICMCLLERNTSSSSRKN